MEFRAGSLHLPALGLWLDAHDPQHGPERVFVSHAHADHVAAHREVILSGPTAKLMQARLPGSRFEHLLNFGEPKRFEHHGTAWQLTLLPAGHIFGSAMSLIEVEGQTLLYTGDFKLRRGRSAEPCEPRHADVLVMETTFGRPQYVFPPTDAVLKGVARFCHEALDNDETPVLLGYSLGKSQELLCGLAELGLPLMLHGATHKLTQVYEEFGQCFPPYEPYDAARARGKVLLCPPQVVNSALMRHLGKTRTAILTGWAVEPNCRYRYQCDAAFPLSDHADFPDLVDMVKRVQPQKVYTLHGFAADFAQTLRELGYDAQALSQDEQLTLGVPRGEGRASKSSSSPSHSSRITSHASRLTESPSPAPSAPASDSFFAFARTCAAIAADARKLEKTRLLAEYLRGLTPVAAGLAATWFSGRPFPSSHNKVLQLGWAVLRDALRAVADVDEQTFHQVYLKHSDLGETARELLEHREVEPSLSVEEVSEVFEKLYAARGPLAKTPLLRTTLERCTALEAKYLVKIITGDLRIGLKEGLVEDAVAGAFGRPVEAVRQANLLVGDIGEVTQLAAADRLQEATLTPFRPLKCMLASPEATAADIWERMQSSTVWLEDKYDGIRCQFHKVGPRVALYSRDLKDITTTFLELADAARTATADFVLDGEIVAMRGDEVLPFAALQKRLGRRQGDLFIREEVPIRFVAFDLLWLQGQSCLERPLRERRAALEALFPENEQKQTKETKSPSSFSSLPSVKLPSAFRLAHITQADSPTAIDAAFDAARSRGNEGLMIKAPDSLYTPGRRGLAWLKLKKAFATLDCVVVGAEYGHGKRSKVLSDYTFAVRDERTDELKTIGKAYSGLTDAEIAQLTQHFLHTAIRQHGRYFEVEPDTVLEIAFDRIQASERHSSGLALRFPRIARIRTDKTPAQIDTMATARKLAKRE
jgi:DNA ligase 1